MDTAKEIRAEILRLEDDLRKVVGMKTEVYTRIVGYYRAVKNWNKGKREEYGFRETFSLPKSLRSEQASAPINDEVSWMLFTKKTCVKCPPVKDYIGKLPMKGAMVDVDSDEGLAQAKKFSVMSAPTAVFLDKTGREIFRAHAVEEIVSRIGPMRV
jgi:hypothetical protein